MRLFGIEPIEIDGEEVEPIFGLGWDGKLVEALEMSVWDPKNCKWDTRSPGYTLAYFGDSKPISAREAAEIISRSIGTKHKISSLF